MTILVTGATGNVGAEVVQALASGGHPVRALVTSASPATDSDVEFVAGDLDDPASLRPAFAGVDAAFLLPGYRDMPGLYRELEQAGVRRVVQLSGGSAGSRDMSNAVTAFMVRSEDAARASGLTWTILRPAAFMSNAFRWKPQLAAGDRVEVPFADVAVAVVDPADIGAVAATALVDGELAGQVLTVTGPQVLLPEEQVAILGEALGRTLQFAAQSNDVAREALLGTNPPEYVDAFFDFYVAGSLDESQVLPTVGTVTGRDPRTFQQWVHAHVDDFAG